MKRVMFKFTVVVAALFAGSLDSYALPFFDAGTEIGLTLCQVVGWINGGIGAAIASFAVIFLGIGAFFGKVTWGNALLTATAIFTIFGSDAILMGLGYPGCGYSL